MRKITPKKENHLQSTGRQMEETNGKMHLGGVPQKEKKNILGTWRLIPATTRTFKRGHTHHND